MEVEEEGLFKGGRVRMVLLFVLSIHLDEHERVLYVYEGLSSSAVLPSLSPFPSSNLALWFDHNFF